MYLYIHIALSRSSQAAAAVTNAVVTSASKGSGNPLCRREIGRKKLAVHKRSGSHGWIPRWQYSERLPGVPFLKDLLLSPSLSLSHIHSLFLFFLSRSLLYASLRLSVLFFFYIALFLRAKVPPPCLRLPWRHSSEDEEGPAKTSYLPSFIRVLLDGRCTSCRSFFLGFFNELSLLQGYNVFIAFNKHRCLKRKHFCIQIRKTFRKEYKCY